MNIYEYFNYIINAMLGIDLLPINTLYEYYSNLTEWAQIFNPSVFISSLLYIGVGVGLFQLTLIFPFRLLKRLIKYPSKKRSEL